jgi:succinoglycan biosynthesis protein ExoA
MTSSYKPFVSVVIPCHNEEQAIDECLSSVLAQSYPASRMEILLADGRSTDGTRGVVRDVARRNPHAIIRVVDNPERIQSAGCNHAIMASRGDVIVRMDAHARYHEDYVARSVAALAATGADNVGGAARPIYRTFFQRALATALMSPLAVGNAAYRSSSRQGWVDTVWNGAFRRSVFERVGLFDAGATTNEDAELNLRIVKAGGRVFLSRDVIAYYVPRSSLSQLLLQYLRYGMGRARTTLKHRQLQSLRPLGPFALTMGLLFSLVLALYSKTGAMLLTLVLGVYFACAAIEAFRITRQRGLELFPVVLAIFPALHLAHGMGFALGLVQYGLAPDWPLDPLLLPPRPAAPPLRARLGPQARSDARAH